MNNIEQMVKQLDTLILEADQTARTEINHDQSTLREANALSNRLEAAIERIAVAGSTYITQLNLYRGNHTIYSFMKF